jgi:predicted acyltransferase
MIVVNAADLGGQAHPWLRHSLWDGCTPADLVFPGFLVIMGAALGFALRAYDDTRWSRAQIYTRVLRRGAILFGLGMLLNLLSAPDLENLRIMGVLQRIALCYVLAAGVLLELRPRVQYAVVVALLLGYWAALRLIPVPDEGLIRGTLPAYLDRMLLGRSHLLQASPYDSEMDPEGLLTTLPATVNVLLGAFAGRFLTRQPLASGTSARLLTAGAVTAVAGLIMSVALPLNKALWTSSYVLVTSGAALVGFGAVHELVDVRHLHRLSRPFEVIGMNAVVAYLVSTGLNLLALRAIHSELYLRYVESLPDHTEGTSVGLWVVVTQALLIWALVEALHRRGWYLRV